MPPRELARLYDAHAASLVGHLRGLLREDADALDVLQGLFQKLATRPQILAGVRDERGFLLRMAHHAALDLCRRQATRQRTQATLAEFAENTGPTLFASSDDPDEAAFRAQLTAALQTLPIEQRAVLQLKLWEERTFEQIATILEIPVNTAASRYRYGIDKLRSLLRPLYDEIR